MPSTPNGLKYICVEGGTSGATEPSWTTVSRGMNEDGSGNLLWMEYGRELSNIYNWQRGVYLLWKTKAAKVSKNVDTTLAGGGSAGTFAAKCSQQYRQCIEQMKAWGTFEIS